MAFPIGIFSAKPVYCHNISMTFDRAGYRYNAQQFGFIISI